MPSSRFTPLPLLAAFVVTLCVSPGPRVSAEQTSTAPREQNVDVQGYAEWRHGDDLIVDGQRVNWTAGARFKGDKTATSFATIPLGYEVNGKGVRQSDGRIVARELEAKPNGVALFEPDLRQSMADVERQWLMAGAAFQTDSEGKEQQIGRLHTTGPDVDRVRRVATRLTPRYLDAKNFRVYVVENKDWNAFAAPNGMIVVYDALLQATTDDELAIIVGHELVHATHEHSRREFKKSMLVQLLALGIVVGTEKIDNTKARAVLQLATVFGFVAWQSGYSRGAEDQADRVGLRYVYEAGYNVGTGPRLWHRFAEKYGNDNAVVNFFFGSHSRSLTRAAHLDAEIALNYSGRR